MAFDVRLALLLLFFPSGRGLNIRGSWDSGEFSTVIAKFGFQKTDPLNLDHTRGFIYGNVTMEGGDSQLLGSSRVLLVLASRTYFARLHAARRCPEAMRDISAVAFDHRCLKKGGQDFFRWVPCPLGGLCPDEDEPDVVVPGAQLTYRTQDKFSAGYWYLLLIACDFDAACNWTANAAPLRLSYDLWLVNGDPAARFANPFEHQFSFDEQDTAEIYMVAFFVFFCLSLLQSRAVALVAKDPPKRLRALRIVCWVKTSGIAWNLLHVFIYAFNGRGLLVARWLGDLTNLLSSSLLMLTVVLLARGWSLRTRVVRSPRFVLGLWGGLSLAHLLLFIWNSSAVDAIEEIDIFETYPGYGILILRLLATLWFLCELRSSVHTEEREERITFLVHFGAGFLVWFLHLPLLGAVASQVDLLWRFKTILSVSYLADFVGLGMLVHLLWPRSANRRHFLDEEEMEKMLGRTDDLEDFELPEDPHPSESPRVAHTHSSPLKNAPVPPHLDLIQSSRM